MSNPRIPVTHRYPGFQAIARAQDSLYWIEGPDGNALPYSIQRSRLARVDEIARTGDIDKAVTVVNALRATRLSAVTNSVDGSVTGSVTQLGHVTGNLNLGGH